MSRRGASSALLSLSLVLGPMAARAQDDDRPCATRSSRGWRRWSRGWTRGTSPAARRALDELDELDARGRRAAELLPRPRRLRGGPLRRSGEAPHRGQASRTSPAATCGWPRRRSPSSGATSASRASTSSSSTRRARTRSSCPTRWRRWRPSTGPWWRTSGGCRQGQDPRGGGEQRQRAVPHRARCPTSRSAPRAPSPSASSTSSWSPAPRRWRAATTGRTRWRTSTCTWWSAR